MKWLWRTCTIWIDKRERRSLTGLKITFDKILWGWGSFWGGMFRGVYRYRCGNYRIIYTVDQEGMTVMILRTANRKNVYEDPVDRQLPD
ncbi:type II toxin-antitoxin system RelE family toxin [Syntrophus aciditrophicus]|nr:type II toxin-antitoxin system RelE/ParE family toxin [Syntrophus aciditrophicus]